MRLLRIPPPTDAAASPHQAQLARLDPLRRPRPAPRRLAGAEGRSSAPRGAAASAAPARAAPPQRAPELGQPPQRTLRPPQAFQTTQVASAMITHEGHLYKKGDGASALGTGNVFRRRYFVLKDGKVYYYKTWEDYGSVRRGALEAP